MKFKFQIRNIMYYKKAIKYFFQIYKSYLFLFIVLGTVRVVGLC